MKKILKYNIHELSITDERLYNDPVEALAAFIIATLIVIIQILLKDELFAFRIILILGGLISILRFLLEVLSN